MQGGEREISAGEEMARGEGKYVHVQLEVNMGEGKIRGNKTGKGKIPRLGEVKRGEEKQAQVEVKMGESSTYIRWK